MDTTPRPHRWAHTAGGVLAAGSGMAAGHALAGLVLPAASPVLAVGTTVVRLAPEPLKQWAIRTFGDADKAVLVGSVVVVTLLVAMVAGRLSRTRPAVGVTFVAVLGTAVVAAAVTSPAVAAAPEGTLLRAVAPGLVAAAVALAVLLVLRRTLVAGAPPADVGETSAPEPPPESPLDHVAIGYVPGTTARRRFLTGAAGVVGGSVALGLVGQRLARPGAVADLDDIAVGSSAPPLPTGLDGRVEGITPFRTPLRDFYRVDTALTVPRVDRDRWRLTVDGDVDRRLELTFAELVSEFEVVERDVTLTCVSNEVGGPYVSSGRWLGVRTADVLARAGVRPGTEQVFSRSSDGMTISTPLAALTDGREAMIAVGLNGEPLPRERGYPARLLTPGLYGFVGATKWLVRLTATTYARDQAYWTRRDWATDAPIKTQSRIDTPRGLAEVTVGTVRVGGVSWAQRRGIDRVEVRLDDGDWQDAVLGSEANIDYWRQWYCDVEVTTPGRHDIEVRATDGSGEVQTDERTGVFPDGASGRATVVVRAA